VLGVLQLLFARGEVGGEHDVESLVAVPVGLEQVADDLHGPGAESRLLAQLPACQVHGVDVPLGLPRALGELPVAAPHRIPVLLDELESAVEVRDHQGEVGLLDDPEDALATVQRAGLVLADGHPAVLVDDGAVEGDELGAPARSGPTHPESLGAPHPTLSDIGHMFEKTVHRCCLGRSECRWVLGDWSHDRSDRHLDQDPGLPGAGACGHRDERAGSDAADRRRTMCAPAPRDRVDGVVDPR